ncbi:hypothetical protein V1525DRAFT_435245 [Lipomyces kononenkoae]|uniref:Uncharacterized protein n=1 Tax=Lipomyces kononenkoae TaxID=34357 RepID=A0ACC3SVM9_LIPKO
MIRGRLVLITGASGGIGASCAHNLFAQGAHLALTYSSNKTAIDGLIAELQSQGATHRLSSHKVDIGNPDDIQRLFDEIQAFHNQPGPDILISNAGYGKRISDIGDISLEEFDYMITINLRASFILSKLAVPHMKAQKWGRIIFISSIAAIGGGINGCYYAASAGLTGMMKNLANKLAQHGINC